MKRNLLYFLLLLLPVIVHSQVVDNFSDGNFTSNPVWVGDTAFFKVNTSKQLQLNAAGEGISSLSTVCSLADSMEWNFWVKLSFAPSDNNFARIYLMTDQPDLKSALNGYYIKLGENGSADAIELVKQSGTTHSTLCRGTDGTVAASFAIRIKVVRSKTGQWKVYADLSGGSNFQLQASALDNTFAATQAIGVYCKYTSSNSTKFYFDDFYAGGVILDLTPPDAISAKVISASGVDVRFSEGVDAVSAASTSNFLADNGLANPSAAERDAQDLALVHLTFGQGVQPDVNYTLSVSNVKDFAGNVMHPAQLPFAVHVTRTFDILINEIMADPSPVVGLPEFEFVELYNRSNFPIDLEGWNLLIGSTAKALPQVILLPGSYLLVGHNNAQPSLSTYGNFVGFSSFSITNTSGTITLLGKNGELIHFVSYSDKWYNSTYRKNGGWSLELIDPLNPCGDAANWTASNDLSGGTPGRVNSVKAPNPDNLLPVMQRIGIVNPSEISVWFSETLDSTTLMNPAAFTIDQGIGNPVGITRVAPDYKQVVLTLPQPVTAGVLYTLTLNGTFKDCAGNETATGSSLKFAVPGIPLYNDIVINELLFNPYEGSVDFVEILNRSDKAFDMKDLIVAGYDSTFNMFSSITDLSAQSFLFLPGEYYVLSSDSAAVKKFYKTPNPLGFVNLERLPSMNNSDGSIALALKNGEMIDWVAYTEKMQFPLLQNVKGVSLERINPNRSARDAGNWHSASGSVGYATPAYQNSQFGTTPEVKGEITLSPSIFSPDNDGLNDFLTIGYKFGTPGFTGSVSIYDANGYLVRELINNELLGTEGIFTWDGISNDRMKAPIGRYIVLVEVFALDGTVKRFRKTTVLGGKL